MDTTMNEPFDPPEELWFYEYGKSLLITTSSVVSLVTISFAIQPVLLPCQHTVSTGLALAALGGGVVAAAYSLALEYQYVDSHNLLHVFGAMLPTGVLLTYYPATYALGIGLITTSILAGAASRIVANDAVAANLANIEDYTVPYEYNLAYDVLEVAVVGMVAGFGIALMQINDVELNKVVVVGGSAYLAAVASGLYLSNDHDAAYTPISLAYPIEMQFEAEPIIALVPSDETGV
jgi:hypothetical protein